MQVSELSNTLKLYMNCFKQLWSNVYYAVFRFSRLFF